MSKLTQDSAEKVVAMFCPTTKVKITDGGDGIYLTKTNEIHCGKDWSLSGLLHEIAHAKYYLEENKTGHDGRYADILTKITDEYMSSTYKELDRTRKALDYAIDVIQTVAKMSDKLSREYGETLVEQLDNIQAYCWQEGYVLTHEEDLERAITALEQKE